MSIYEAIFLVVTVASSTALFVIGLVTLMLLLKNDK